MTIVTTWFAESNKAGVNLNYVQSTVASDPSYPQAPIKLGERIEGNNGSDWIYVQASATVTVGNVVAIDSVNQARNATQTMVSTTNSYSYGVANQQPNQLGATVSIGNANGGVINPGEFFWACMRAANGMAINAIATLATGSFRVFLTSTNPGIISTTATNSYFQGLGVVVSLTTSTVVVPSEVVMTGWLVPVSVTA